MSWQAPVADTRKVRRKGRAAVEGQDVVRDDDAALLEDRLEVDEVLEVAALVVVDEEEADLRDARGLAGSRPEPRDRGARRLVAAREAEGDAAVVDEARARRDARRPVDAGRLDVEREERVPPPERAADHARAEAAVAPELQGEDGRIARRRDRAPRRGLQNPALDVTDVHHPVPPPAEGIDDPEHRRRVAVDGLGLDDAHELRLRPSVERQGPAGSRPTRGHLVVLVIAAAEAVHRLAII